MIDEVGRFDGVADGVAVGPILARHRLIDDGEGGGTHRLGVTPHAALFDRNAQQRKIFGADEVHADFGRAEIGAAEEIDADVVTVDGGAPLPVIVAASTCGIAAIVARSWSTYWERSSSEVCDPLWKGITTMRTRCGS